MSVLGHVKYCLMSPQGTRICLFLLFWKVLYLSNMYYSMGNFLEVFLYLPLLLVASLRNRHFTDTGRLGCAGTNKLCPYIEDCGSELC